MLRLLIAALFIEICAKYWCELADCQKLKVYVFLYSLRHLERIFRANRAVCSVSRYVLAFERYKVKTVLAGCILAGWLALASLRLFLSGSLGYGAHWYCESAGEVRLYVPTAVPTVQPAH